MRVNSGIHNYESQRSEILVWYPKVPKGHSIFAPRIEEEIVEKTIKNS